MGNIGTLYKGKKRPAEAVAKQKETRALNQSIKLAIYDELKKQLLNGKTPYYQDFIQKYLDKAKADPNSRAAQTVADTIFQTEILSMLDEAHEKEMANDREFMRYKLIKQFFKEQREVIYEVNHSKKIIACCSRRAGKTDLASGAIVSSAMTPNSRIIYINLTHTNAVNQIFDNVVERSEAAGLTISSSSKSTGDIAWHNGSSLRIVGNSNNAEADKLRGEKMVSLIVIDEFFHQRNLEYAINEVISPLMLDRKDSCMLCLGTPPRIPHTFGEKCWNEQGWTRFHWTFRENPYIPDADTFINDLCKSKGLTIDAPFIQREFFGIIGSYDTECMVFKDYKTINSDIPERFDKIYIGVDLGFEDDNGIVALAYNKNRPAYVIFEDKFNHAPVSETINRVKEIYNKCRKISDDVAIYSDCNNKELVYELYSVQHLPAFTCYKHDKSIAIQQLAEWCRTGKINIPANGFLSDEFERILYKRDDEDNIIPEIDDEIFHPNIMMALLYASRQYWYDIGNELGGESQVKKDNWAGLPDNSLSDGLTPVEI